MTATPDGLLACVILAAAVGGAAFIISTAKISMPVRMWVAGRRQRSPAWQWLFELLNCPFCVSVWLAAGAAVVYRPRVVHFWEPLDLLVAALAMSSLSMLAVVIIKQAVASVPRTRTEPPVRLPASGTGNSGGGGGGGSVGPVWSSAHHE